MHGLLTDRYELAMVGAYLREGIAERRAVFELMTMNTTLREMAFNSEPAQNIRRQARLLGMKTLVEDAKDKAFAGLTTLAEVYKLSKGGH